MIYIPTEARKALKQYISFNDMDVVMLECRKNLKDNEWYCVKGQINEYNTKYVFIMDNYKILLYVNDECVMSVNDKDYDFEGLPKEEFVEDCSIMIVE
jgi:hypothetical protein